MDQYGSLLIPVIMSKLPSEIRLQIARNSKDSVWKIDELLSVTKIEVEAREASEMTKTSEERKSTQRSGQQNFCNQPPTLNSLVSRHSDGWKNKMNVPFAETCIILPYVILLRMLLNKETC